MIKVVLCCCLFVNAIRICKWSVAGNELSSSWSFGVYTPAIDLWSETIVIVPNNSLERCNFEGSLYYFFTAHCNSRIVADDRSSTPAPRWAMLFKVHVNRTDF